MAVESVDFIPVGKEIESLLNEFNPSATQANTQNFAAWLQTEMGHINHQINEAELQVQRLAVGETDNLHQVMSSLSKAKLGFELGLQVRNKLLEGYQEIMRMQV
ncbi:MAG: flagellar hook-basal body complex protein FliE [Neptuniibacter sp.]